MLSDFPYLELFFKPNIFRLFFQPFISKYFLTKSFTLFFLMLPLESMCVCVGSFKDNRAELPASFVLKHNPLVSVTRKALTFPRTGRLCTTQRFLQLSSAWVRVAPLKPNEQFNWGCAGGLRRVKLCVHFPGNLTFFLFCCWDSWMYITYLNYVWWRRCRELSRVMRFNQIHWRTFT